MEDAVIIHDSQIIIPKDLPLRNSYQYIVRNKSGYMVRIGKKSYIPGVFTSESKAYNALKVYLNNLDNKKSKK